MKIYYIRHKVFKIFTTFAILCCRSYEITLSAADRLLGRECLLEVGIGCTGSLAQAVAKPVNVTNLELAWVSLSV